MIYSLDGELIAVEASLAVIECGGVGYACRATYPTIAKLGSIGSHVRLYTYLHVREDNIELFGFYSKEELNCFKMLISVSGVGPKAALAILSDIDAQRFALIVASGDSKAFTKTKGIGAKLAQRIVLELKDKIAKESIDISEDIYNISRAADDNSSSAEAISALVVLGYSQSEAALAVSKLDQGLESSEMIKQALKVIASGM